MPWYFRVVQTDDGRWICQHGKDRYDTHATYEGAIDHITAIASQQRPADILAHPLGQDHGASHNSKPSPTPGKRPTEGASSPPGGGGVGVS